MMKLSERNRTVPIQIGTAAGSGWLSLCVAVGLLSTLMSRPAHGSDDPATLSACGGPPAGTSQLTSFVNLKVPAKYWVEMAWHDREWWPAGHIPMPHHHATRLELTNLADFTSLDAHRTERVRLTIEITSREIRKVPDRYQWRATYHAKILEACLHTPGG